MTGPDEPPSPDCPPLPTCPHRGEPRPVGVRLKFSCSHPQHRPGTTVSAGECRACWQIRWDAAGYVSRYSQPRPSAPTAEQYAARLTACDGCPERDGDWCLEAPGCRLTEKCKRPDFGCPLRKFARLDRAR